MIDSKFKEAYWLFRTHKISSLREMGSYMGHSKYYHKGIYAKAAIYESSPEYKEDLKKYQGQTLRGEISNKDFLKEPSRGRKRKKGITDEFKKIYWQYENYEISPTTAFEKTGYSKNWFYKIAKAYEKTTEFENDLKNQKDIDKKPCRVQIIPTGFKEDSNTMTLIDLSKKYKLPQIQCKRLILKLDKKNIWKCIKQYSKE